MFEFAIKLKFFRTPLPKNKSLKQCYICNSMGILNGSYCLSRPICCEPIRVCRNHSKAEILRAFLQKNPHCEYHHKKNIAEVEYISIS